MLTVDITGGVSLRKRLQALRLPPGKRRQINRALARKVGSFSKKRIREQRDLSGRAFAARKSGRGKMLRGLSKRMKVYASGNNGKVYWSGGKVAAKHQHGHTETWDADKAAKRNRSNKSQDDPATRRQAKRLRELGFKIRRGRGWKTPTIKWITENMTIGHAGAVIRSLKGSSKDNWKVHLPARSFLGVTDRDEQVLIETLEQLILRYS